MNTLTDAPEYDVLHVANLLQISYDKEELATFALRPRALPGLITFFDPGWNIIRLRDAVKDKHIFRSQHWYLEEAFLQSEEQPRYRQLQMEVVNDSFMKTFVGQQALVPPDREIPLARVVVMGTVIHFLATEERIFTDHWVRCIDQTSAHYRAWVGNFDRGGLHVASDWDGYRYSDVGLASSRKF